MAEMSEAEDYLKFKALLHRARSFSTLVFYNESMLDPYLLASYGFHSSINNKDESVEAKCQYCRVSFKLDPLCTSEIFQVKDPINYVLKNHQKQCQITKYTNNFDKKPYELNKAAMSQQGAAYYQEILKSYDKYEEDFDVNAVQLFEGESLSIKRCLRVLNDNSIKAAIVGKSILSLLGWKLKKSEDRSVKEIFCGYCREQEQFGSLSFHPIESHASNCILTHQGMWRIILKKLTIYSLENVEGEFLKTKGLIKAKQIRSELTSILNQYTPQMENFTTKIAQIRQSLEAAQSAINNQTAGAEQSSDRRNNRMALSQMLAFARETEECFREGIKRVKIE